MLKILLFTTFLAISTSEKIDDSIHYYIQFTADALAIKSAPKLEDAKNDDFIRISSKNNENFLCKLPEIDQESSKSIDYQGPGAGEILETQLYKDNMCSYLIDVYWTYQVCHGRYVIQFHEDKLISTQVARTEYYLGNFDAILSKVAQRPPQTKRIENEDYPYFSVPFTHGTTCDVTGKPRTTDVIYICVEKVQHKILSVTEVSSCHYEIIIMTDLLCKHPEYRLSEKKDHKIVCYNEQADDENSAKPKMLQKVDDFHDSTFKREYTVEKSENLEENEGDLIDLDELERIKSAQTTNYALIGEKRFESGDSLANNPSVVRHTVNRILTGEDCIVGGAGWWRYEFCYGKHVIQFHEDKGQRDEILLGLFDEVIHKEWVKLNIPTRGPQKDQQKGLITQISHLYAKGDLCAETGAHRDVEVRLRCATADYSALGFSMHLTEPSTCQYVLTIESERFCEPLQYADQLGVIEIRAVESAEYVGITDQFEEEQEILEHEEL